MLYLISLEEDKGKIDSYVFFESHTESFFRGDENFVRRILGKHGMRSVNLKVLGEAIRVKRWPNPLHRQSFGLASRPIEDDKYVLVCKIDNDTFRLVDTNEMICQLSGTNLKRYIKNNKVTNCCVEDGVYKSIDTSTISSDTKFEESVDKQYERHIALTSLLGQRMSFDYTIEGRSVKLKKYTGTNKNVIVPNFITTIMKNAFLSSKIEYITLNNGLRHIGDCAFGNCNISEIIIPESVEFICGDAFRWNTQLINDDCTYKSTIRLLNEKTTIIHGYRTRQKRIGS